MYKSLTSNSMACIPCDPCDPCGDVKVYSEKQLSSMPQYPSMCPPQFVGPRYVQVQQPPRVVCQKKVIYCNRTVIDKHVIPQTKVITEPKLIYEPKTIIEPCIIYKKRVIQQPKIIYCKRIVPDPKVICKPRVISEPKEICQNILCQPKPQMVQVPPPKEFVCSPSGNTYYSGPNQIPCLPLQPVTRDF